MGEAHSVDWNENGRDDLRQEDVEVPKSWSKATETSHQQVFHGKPGTPSAKGRTATDRRVVSTLLDGARGRVFADAESREGSATRLTHLLVGTEDEHSIPVGSPWACNRNRNARACFINSVSDNMESIMG